LKRRDIPQGQWEPAAVYTSFFLLDYDPDTNPDSDMWLEDEINLRIADLYGDKWESSCDLPHVTRNYLIQED